MRVMRPAQTFDAFLYGFDEEPEWFTAAVSGGRVTKFNPVHNTPSAIHSATIRPYTRNGKLTDSIDIYHGDWVLLQLGGGSDEGLPFTEIITCSNEEFEQTYREGN